VLDDLARDAQLVHQHHLGADDGRGDLVLRRVRSQLQVRHGAAQRRRVEVVVEADGGVVEENGAHRQKLSSNDKGWRAGDR